MEDNGGECDRAWGELLPDVLSLIFQKTSLQEILTVVPAVCKSWRTVVLQPSFWQDIDIEEWCRRSKRKNVERMVEMLVMRSQGSIRKLSVFGLSSNNILAFIASYSDNLQVLRMPSSHVTDSIVTQVAPKLANLTYLDISYCEKLTASSLESLGKHCKFLTRLSRCMHAHSTFGQYSNDDEAFSIANNMPRLKHLELSYGLLSDAGVEALLNMCRELEHLDIWGCWKVTMKNSLADRCRKLNVSIRRVVSASEWYGILDTIML